MPLKMPNQIILIYKTYLYMNIQWSQQIIYNQCPLRLFIHLITNIVVRQPNLLVFCSPWNPPWVCDPFTPWTEQQCMICHLYSLFLTLRRLIAWQLHMDPCTFWPNRQPPDCSSPGTVDKRESIKNEAMDMLPICYILPIWKFWNNKPHLPKAIAREDK